ncbi:hypothetical protein [Collimonas humicola]|uniref:hypothetical protein n=1 Tax=Collimonas humicola TaxID=2825886 RepID=UPI001B8C9519|nr:hypothetical protein [Collimonas humicola]
MGQLLYERHCGYFVMTEINVAYAQRIYEERAKNVNEIVYLLMTNIMRRQFDV